MKPLLVLLKIQLRGLFNSNKWLHTKPQQAKRTIGLGLAGAVVVLAVIELYVFLIMSALIQSGLGDVMVPVAVLGGSLFGIVPAFIKANGVLFSLKDYDLIMALPVPVRTVVLSRIASLYLSCALAGLLIMVPPFVLYAAYVSVGALGIVAMVVAILIAPLLPLFIAIVLSALISAIAAHFRRIQALTSIIMVLLTLVVVGGMMFFMSAQEGSFAISANMANQIMDKVGAFYPPAIWAAAGITEGNLAAFALFIILSIAVGAVALMLLVRLFVPINAALMQVHPRSSFSFDTTAQGGTHRLIGGIKSPFRALLVKEFHRLIATPMYLLNAAFGFVVVLVGSIALGIAYATGSLSLETLASSSFLSDTLPLSSGLAWASAFFFGVSSTTCASVSLEGSARWFILSAPVSVRMVLGAKAALNLVIALPVLVVSSTLLVWVLTPDWQSALLLYLVPLAYLFFATFVGLALDVRYPRYDWTSIYEPVKRGLPVFCVIFGGMILVVCGLVAQLIIGFVAAISVAVVLILVSLLVFRHTLQSCLKD